MRPRVRNPRRTTRAEPARNADAHNVPNPRVLLILLVVVVEVTVAIAVAVRVAVAVAAAAVEVVVAEVVVVITIIKPYSSPILACQTKLAHAKHLVSLLDGGEQSNSESNKATSNRTPSFSKLCALWNDWLLCLMQANRATKSPPVRWDC